MTSFQRFTTPTRAALIYTLEPVFSIGLAGDRLTPWAGPAAARHAGGGAVAAAGSSAWRAGFT